MAYKVTISDGTILEKSIETVTFNANPPPDNYYCMRTYTINSMIITGRIGAGEKTISLYEWALLPANSPYCYKEIVVEQIHAGQIVRNVKFSKAFVVDYSESFSKSVGVGYFSILIRQLVGVDIELINEITPQPTMTEIEPTNAIEKISSPQVQGVGIAKLSNATNSRTNFTDIIAKKLSRESVVDKLDKYLLNPKHPVGSSKAKWFYEALGFNKSNLDNLANQIIFDPAKAVQTGVTEFGTKYNQVISVTGTNGKTIDVTFAWIRNNDGIVRLVTGIPAKN